MKKIKVVEKLNIVIVAVLLFSLIFALPCSAQEVNKYFNPTNRQLTASWIVQDGVDNGSQILTYDGSVTIGGLAWLSYGNVPFNIGTDGSSYTLEVMITGLVIGLDKVDTPWHVVTRYAIGNGSSIYSLVDCAMIIESSDGANVQYLNQIVKGNVAYVNDDINVYSAGSYNIKLVFNFPRTDWSMSNHLYLFGFNFTRQITVQESISNSTDLIINDVGDGTINNNVDSANSNSSSITEKEDYIESLFPDVGNDYILDLEVPITMVATFSYIGDWFGNIIDGFGFEFHFLWYLLVYVGLLGTILGVVAMITRGRK